MLLVALAHSSEAAERTEGPFTCPMGRQYWLGFPHGYDPQKTYWLVAAAHGAGGNGDHVKMWQMPSRRTDYIVVAPSYPDSPTLGYYQGLGGQADTQLIGLFQQLKTKYRLREQLFLDGFSGGSQFCHRFAMAHPDLVVGCSAHSGGTWGPLISKDAMGVPMFFSCGLDDIDSSFAGALPRILGAEQYFNALVKEGLFVKVRYWQGFAHQGCPSSSPIIAELFELATTGLFPHQRAAVDAELSRIDGLIAADDFPQAKKALTAMAKFKLPANVAKQPSRAGLSAEQQADQRKEFVKAGIGGLSALKRDFWIDDRNENQDGWNENLAARAAMQQRFRAWIFEECAARVARVKVGMAPASGGKRTAASKP